jgi:curved DNA-binding protein
VEFQDYYEVLGVSREASTKEIQKAYRSLARKYHPDVSKEADAESRFRQINEAYAVLKDKEKREHYDALGEKWKHGEQYQGAPPRGDAYGGADQYSYGGGGGEQHADFSDFFQSVFGGRGGFAGGGFGMPQGGAWQQRGTDHAADVEITLEEAARGGSKRISLQKTSVRPDGTPSVEQVNYEVKIPAGVTNGSRIRMSGQGGEGAGGGGAGDLYLRIRLRPDSRFRVDGHTLETTIDLTPWEAALGTEVVVPTLDGRIRMKVAAGTASGTKHRIAGKGLPRRRGKPADLLVKTRIVVPKELSKRERELFEELASTSKFQPRNS